MSHPTPPTRPTVYQIGAVPHAPDLRRMFDRWADDWAARAKADGTAMGEEERPQLERLDIRPKEGWPAIVEFMAFHGAVWGAMVFEEKTRILATGAGHLAQIGADAVALGEVNAIVAGPDGLIGTNSGVVAAAHSLATQLGGDYWRDRPAAELVVLGTGSRAMSFAIAARRLADGSRPARILVVDADPSAIERARTVLGDSGGTDDMGAVELLAVDPDGGPAPTLARLAAGTVVVHAPRPALVAEPAAFGPGFRFPRDGIAWDLDLDPGSLFLRRASADLKDGNTTLGRVDGTAHYQVSLALILAEIFRVDRAEALAAAAGATPGGDA